MAADANEIMFAYDGRTEDALVEILGHLPPAITGQVPDDLHDQAAASELTWTDIQHGYLSVRKEQVAAS
eukprot:2370331-Karenia_brevis.AAC.1